MGSAGGPRRHDHARPVHATDAPVSYKRAALVAAAILLGGAALLGMAATTGLLPGAPSFSTLARLLNPAKRIAGTAPTDSLSPGESVIVLPKSAELRRAARRRPTEIPTEVSPAEQATDSEPAGASPAEGSGGDTKVAVAESPEVKPTGTGEATEFIEIKPIETSISEAKAAEMKLAETKRIAEVTAIEAKIAERKRVAEMIATEAKLAETKRIAETMAAEAKAAEEKRVAEMKAAQAKIAETKRVAEMMAAEAKIAESKRMAEMIAAEAKIAETKRVA